MSVFVLRLFYDMKEYHICNFFRQKNTIYGLRTEPRDHVNPEAQFFLPRESPELPLLGVQHVNSQHKVRHRVRKNTLDNTFGAVQQE